MAGQKRFQYEEIAVYKSLLSYKLSLLIFGQLSGITRLICGYEDRGQKSGDYRVSYAVSPISPVGSQSA
jgi:hypothetical protein